MNKVTDLALNRWSSILADLAGLSPEQLTDKHQPCPLCGGEDRYRYDDKDGTGSWYCNQCGGRDQRGGGGTGMDLLMRRNNWDFKEAAKRIESYLGIVKQRPEPPIQSAESSWRYSENFIVARFPGKKIRPLWFDGDRWQWKAPPAPRPLLNLDAIRSSDKTILVVEGEKAWTAARSLFPQAVCTTWASGCKAINKTDWTPLADRKVLLWPDNDQVGRDAMDRLARKLMSIGVERIQIITPPREMAEGWDLADASWSPQEAADYAKNNVSNPLVLDVEEAIEDEPDDPAPPDADPELPAEWPFRCLGFDRGYYYYLPNEASQVIELPASGHTKLNLMNLASLDWWCAMFPTKTSFDTDRAADTLMRVCTQQGVFDPSRIRGRGAWYDAGRVILHLGNRLSVIPDQGPPTEHYIQNPPNSYYFYENAKSLIGPASEPLTDEITVELFKLARQFKWEVPASAYFLVGWIVLAPVCGALDWRPHIWITGGAGTGKTTILKHFMRPLLGGIYQAATGGTTEAGLRGTLKSDAIPVVFDEFEQNEQRDKQIVQNILALARIASSEGGKIYKGTSSGGSNSFEIRSMFCVSSINVNLIQKADVDRFCVLGLRRDPISKDDWRDFEQRIYDFATEENGRKLIARTVDNIPFIRLNARTFAAALAKEFGQRYGDQHGTLLAGAWSLSPAGGELISLDQAQKWIQSMDWESHQTDPSEADEMKCLNFILNHMIQVDGKRMTLRELVGMAQRGCFKVTAHREDSEDPSLVIARYGLKIQGDSLAIANGNSNLQAIVRDTPWSGNAYKQSLKRINGVTTPKTAIRFPAMGPMRCLMIPMTVLDL